MSLPVDNALVSRMKHSPIPLPAAVLALSVAVCLGASATAQADTLRAGHRAQADQRQALEHLLEAIQQAAEKLNKKLADRLDGQAAFVQTDSAGRCIAADQCVIRPTVVRPASASPSLREALLNLPPPSR